MIYGDSYLINDTKKMCHKSCVKFHVRILLFYGVLMMEAELIRGLQDKNLTSGSFVLEVSVHCMRNVFLH